MAIPVSRSNGKARINNLTKYLVRLHNHIGLEATVEQEQGVKRFVDVETHLRNADSLLQISTCPPFFTRVRAV